MNSLATPNAEDVASGKHRAAVTELKSLLSSILGVQRMTNKVLRRRIQRLLYHLSSPEEARRSSRTHQTSGHCTPRSAEFEQRIAAESSAGCLVVATGLQDCRSGRCLDDRQCG